MLVSDWKRVILLSLSFWSQVAGLLVLIIPEVLFITTGRDTDPNLLWWLGVLLLVGGLVGRLVAQERSVLAEWVRVVAVLVIVGGLAFLLSQRAYAKDEALDIAVPLIAKWEGLRLDAYLDVVGVPTICYGSTRGVVIGMRKTKQECDALLRSEVSEYHEGWLGYVTTCRLTPHREAAYTSLAYNVGIRAAGRSTATRRLNSGDIRRGCIAIGWWNRAGGRVIRGLVNRRADEVQLCLIGV